MILITELLLKF
ncbi:hypothetical protein F383_18012 [Gossypium arboreum]|uniref:Uncharacterized protein n=1 Tax=Gossypium arboreum TaxID=29729 RepID=A0A0B0NLA3_GOSAR|nr:hypothetical protein F383_18012 [Gossypium arboreum]